MNPRRVLLLVAAPVAAAALGVAAVVATGVHRRLGVSRREAAFPLPGDHLLTGEVVQNDRAITIGASPERVWPWIAQLGQHRAGFYSFEALENALGCEIRNADRVHPEWQHVEVGDTVPLAPGLGLRVAEVGPGSHLVLSSEGGELPPEAAANMRFDFTWAFTLVPVTDDEGRPATRLHVRERYLPHDAATAVASHGVAMVSAIMSWAMLRRIRALAERRH